MTEQQEETHSIWKTIKGSKELFDLYGYFPTLHDAVVTNVEVSFEKKSISLGFEYSDLVGGDAAPGDTSLATKIIICWLGVVESELLFESRHIYDVEYERAGDFIKTVFAQSWGIGGFIISENVEVLSIEPSKRDTVEDVNAFLRATKLRFKN